MDPYTHCHKQLIINTSWGESSSCLLQNKASMEDRQHHHHRSHISFHDQQHDHVRPSSFDHHSSVWQSSSQDHTNYTIPFSHSNQINSSPPAYSAASLFFVGSNISAAHHDHVGPPANHHHQLTLDHHLNSHVLHEEEEHEEEVGNVRKDLFVPVNEEDEEVDNEVDEELSAMKEMMYKIAAMQPVDIDPSTIRKPKRRNVRISDDPQSVAARHRRERISEKMRVLQRLVPGGTKMDTASMLDEAIRYVKFLKRQIKHLQQDQNHLIHDEQLPPTSSASLKSSCLLNTSPANHQYLTVSVANTQQQQQQRRCVRFVAAALPTTATDHSFSTINGAALLHRHQESEKSIDILDMCTSNNNNIVHQCMDNSSIVIQTHQQIDIFNQVTGFIDRR